MNNPNDVGKTERTESNITTVIEPKLNNNQPRSNNNQPKPTTNNSKRNMNFTSSNKREQQKKDILDILTKINNNLGNGGNGVNEKDIIKAILKFVIIISDEQTDVIKRQKIIDETLQKYNDILKNYDDKSFRLDKLEQIMKSISQLKPNNLSLQS